ncbi:MAG: hypothetical protein H7837_10610 [Magnetococcus sp. MYC-9]
MVATLTLCAIVVMMGVPLLSLMLEAHGMAKVMAPVVSEGALVMERMIRELRQADAGSLQLSAGSIAFSTPTGQRRLHQTGGDAGIYLVQETEERLLTRSVEVGSLSFMRWADLPGLVGISFTLSAPLADGSRIRTPLSSAVHVIR